MTISPRPNFGGKIRSKTGSVFCNRVVYILWLNNNQSNTFFNTKIFYSILSRLVCRTYIYCSHYGEHILFKCKRNPVTFCDRDITYYTTIVNFRIFNNINKNVPFSIKIQNILCYFNCLWLCISSFQQFNCLFLDVNVDQNVNQNKIH